MRLDFEEPWSWAQYDKAIDEASARIESARHPVDVLHNLLNGPNMPLDKPLLHLRRMVGLLSKRTTCIVVVGGTPTIRAVLSLFFNVFDDVGQRMGFASSLEEARALLAGWRREIDRLAARVG